jgi:hypothetical protein
MEQSGSGYQAGFGRILVEKIGHMPNQGFDWEPNPGFQARIEPGVLRL